MERVRETLVVPAELPEYNVDDFVLSLHAGLPVQYRSSARLGAAWWTMQVERVKGDLWSDATEIILSSPALGDAPRYKTTVRKAAEGELRPAVSCVDGRLVFTHPPSDDELDADGAAAG